MAESHVIVGLKAKRARIAGEIIRAQEVVAQRTKELLAIDAVLRMFAPDCDPDMIAPIRPTPRGLFFKYGELARLALEIMREAGRPVTLDHIIDLAMEAKGLPDDKRLRKHVTDVARQALVRLTRRGRVRRLLEEPDVWWELVTRDKITLSIEECDDAGRQRLSSGPGRVSYGTIGIRSGSTKRLDHSRR